MQMTEVTFESVLPSLNTILSRLWDCLQEATELASNEGKRSDLAPCPIAYASTVRRRLAKTLPKYLEAQGFELEIGFNMSLTLHCGHMHLRILKAGSASLPSRHTSQGRRNFYNQVSQGQLDFEDAEEVQTNSGSFGLNLVLAWCSEMGRLNSLTLGYPKPMPQDHEELDRTFDEWYWAESLEHMVSNEDHVIDLPDVTLLEEDSRLQVSTGAIEK